ncbi:MAG TPA: sigma-54 dependent transcriptional regulator [Bryobacteraceae bacterium]|nr:sigma-54 dependent transcriptional regulator [Bryobacteraceae bacterium]
MSTEGVKTILVGEDELEVLCYFDMALRSLGYNVETAQDGDELLACLRSSRSEVIAVLLDVFMPKRDGLETLREIRKFYPAMPVIVVSGVASSQNIVTAIKNGATDFLCKPVPHEDLDRALRTALETRSALGNAPMRLNSGGPDAFVGRSPRMKEIQEIASQVGWSEAPVLIQGETGTGKEVLARQLHAESPRAEKLFLKVNCAALPSELVESELFGYERGAFTGAVQKKIGMFEMADGGTILLDEIGDMDHRLQAKLLQVLQDHEFRRIGGKEIVKVDVRVIAATHRDLEKSILEQKFREDLYYRLSVVTLHVPALRDRSEDIVPLAEFLLAKCSSNTGYPCALGAELKRALTEYHWPGNVRELENYMRKLTIMGDGNLIVRELHARSRASVIAPEVPAELPADPPDSEEQVPILEQVTNAKHQAEKKAILSALASTHWNRKHAATLLNIDYKALLYKMRKLGIHERPGSISVKPETANPVIARAQASGN